MGKGKRFLAIFGSFVLKWSIAGLGLANQVHLGQG